MTRREKAYIDCPRNPAGKTPCVVLERFTPCAHLHAVRVRVTASSGPYRRGDVMTWTAGQIVPRAESPS